MGLPTSVGTGVMDLGWDTGAAPKSGAAWRPTAGTAGHRHARQQDHSPKGVLLPPVF